MKITNFRNKRRVYMAGKDVYLAEVDVTVKGPWPWSRTTTFTAVVTRRVDFSLWQWVTDLQHTPNNDVEALEFQYELNLVESRAPNPGCK